MHPLLVNLSFVGRKPTGLATYALNLLPQLSSFLETDTELTLLAPPAVAIDHVPNASVLSAPGNLSPDQGKSGHLRRLWWTQTQVPRLYRQSDAGLFFSPVPEAPLWAGCRSIVVVHDFIPLRFPRRTSPLTQYFRYYVPQVLAQAAHIICNSQATANDIQTFCAIPAAKITPILLAHDANHFRVLERSAPPRPYFLYIGRPDPHKNLSRLISAFAQLPSALSCDLWIAGPPDPRYTPQLQTQAQDLGIADRIRWLDYVPYAELPVLLNQAIGFVFPSLWEGFGFPVLEAMACGAPVITSNLSSLPEVAGDAALLVDPASERELTAAMYTLLTDERTRVELRSVGLQRAAQFSWQKTAEATAQVLRKHD